MLKNKLLSSKIAKTLFAAVFWIAVWQVLYICVSSEILIPSPLSVAEKLFVLAKTGIFWASAGLSLVRIFIGFIAGVLTGTVLAVLTKKILISDTLISPVISVIKATPVASFIILALVWASRETIPSIISFLMVLPIVWGNVGEGIDSIPQNFKDLAALYRFSFKKKLFDIELPAVKPYFAAACKTALGLSWKAGIAAEVLCRPEISVGNNLWASKIYLETTELFAWTAVVIIMSVILEKLLKRFVFGEIKK